MKREKNLDLEKSSSKAFQTWHDRVKLILLKKIEDISYLAIAELKVLRFFESDPPYEFDDEGGLHILRPSDVIFLDDVQRAIVREAMLPLLRELLDRIKNCKSWEDVLEIYVGITDFAKSYFHKTPQMQTIVRCQAIKIFFEVEEMELDVLRQLDIENIDDITLLSNCQIKERLVSKISSETYFSKIKFLSRICAMFRNNEASFKQIIDHSFDKLAPRLGTRNCHELFEDLKNLIFLHTPLIEFKSKDQAQILRNIIAEVAHYTPLTVYFDPEGDPFFEILDRLNFLIDNKSVIKKSSGITPKDPGFSLPKNVKSADIIRMLLSKMTYFNDRYQEDNLDLKLWLHYLFIDTEGFSLNHILNASNRDSKSI